jgi:hypothetical protein
MGGKTASVPAPSAEEKALQQAQADMLRMQQEILQQQRQQQAVLTPFLAEEMGYEIETDEFGNITSISKGPLSETDQQEEDIRKQLNQRTLDALAGNLPVDPALESSLASEEEALRERLAQQFGAGYETSSPAIETLGDFFSNAEGLRAGARTGQLTLAEQLGFARTQSQRQEQQRQFGNITGAAVGQQLGLAGAFGQTAAGYGNAQQPFIQQRQMQTQAAMFNAQQPNPFAQVAGIALGSYFSDARLKTEITPVGPELAALIHHGGETGWRA